MQYLLDTHIFIWARLAPQKLSAAQLSIVSDKATQKCISTIVIWEISLKFSLGKLELGGHTPEEMLDSAAEAGFYTISPDASDFASFYRLPDAAAHKDPFDRMLIWQAIRQDLTLLSHDAAMPGYKIHGLKLG